MLVFAIAFSVVYIGDYTDDFLSITGFSLYNYTNINVTVSSTAPIIKEITTIPSQSVTEATYTDVSFIVQAYDVDGVGTMANQSSMNVTATLAGEDLRYNNSCERLLNINTTTANYSCTIQMWYWDANSANWNITARINDTSGSESNTLSAEFTYALTAGFAMAPPGLTWGSIASTAINQTANEYLRLNNTANKNITAGNVNITGIDLQGLSTPTQYILANSFRAAGPGQTGGTPPSECDITDATAIENGTSISIATMGLPRGNFTNYGIGTSNLSLCLLNVTYGATPQIYSTQNMERWAIGIV